MILEAFVAGESVRADGRIAQAAKGTIQELLAEVGAACKSFLRRGFENLPCRRIEADEVWLLVGATQANTEPRQRGTCIKGDV